jgi:hypothetical protein
MGMAPFGIRGDAKIPKAPETLFTSSVGVSNIVPKLLQTTHGGGNGI